MNEELVLLRPSQPVTESIVRISFHEEAVRVFFPERLDKFQKVMRRYRYVWRRPYYVREFDEEVRSARAAELVRHLLSAGFVVKAAEAIAQAAVAGEFDPESRRWVTVDNDEYAGWFSLRWFRDEDCYHAAKKLPGSRYARPHVVVPPEQFQAVLDFAERYEFKMLPETAVVIAEAEAERDGAIVVSLDPIDEQPLPMADGRVPQLAVPDLVGIDDELLDHD